MFFLKFEAQPAVYTKERRLSEMFQSNFVVFTVTFNTLTLSTFSAHYSEAYLESYVKHL